MIYYGTRLSENISRREPEGYLLCLNVPVARTGTQEYLPEELGVAGPPGELIPVMRPEEEVFAPETIASFEGMPVTDNHPADGVDVTNNKLLQRGHAHNIRRGSGEESDLLLADLIITDQWLIDEILNQGKREISCGYTYELSEENGQFVQRQIRGNHVAVVDAGRAGHRVCIKDHKVDVKMKGVPKMKKSLFKKLARMARDGDVEAAEAIAEVIEEVTEEIVEAPTEVVPVAPVAAPVVPEVVAPVAAPVAAPVVEEPAVEVTTPTGSEVLVDNDALLQAILDKLDQILSALGGNAAAADEDPVEEVAEAVEETIEAIVAEEAGETEPILELPGEEIVAPEEIAEIAEIVEEVIEDPVLSEVLEPENVDCGPNKNGDALRAALRTVRPVLAKMPKKQRDAAVKQIAFRMTGKKPARKTAGAYAALARAKAKDSAKKDPKALGRQIMAKYNANYKK